MLPPDSPIQFDSSDLDEFLEEFEPTHFDPEVYDSEESEKRQLENERLRLENERLRVELGSLKQDLYERKKYASLLFWLVAVWLSAIGMVLMLQGFRPWEFNLADTVLLMLIGTTTGSVIGVFLIVANYLFRKPAAD